MALPAGLAEQIRVHQLTDIEIRKVMRDAAQEADRIVRSLEGVKGVGARVRSAQIALAKVQVEAWGSVGSAVKIGIGDAFDASADMQSLFDRRLFGAAGIDERAWRHSMLRQSRAGIDLFVARTEFNHTLSERVYRNRALSRGYVERAVNNGLLLGKSHIEIAKSVVGYIDPKTPGGASYAALRLGRTEIQNAMHTANTKRYIETPWVEEVRWNLSGSHARPDECNAYAQDEHYAGGEPGVFRAGDVPGKPHPNCLCYTEPLAEDVDAFVRNFKSGKYDDYIDEKLGCVHSA